MDARSMGQSALRMVERGRERGQEYMSSGGMDVGAHYKPDRWNRMAGSGRRGCVARLSVPLN